VGAVAGATAVLCGCTDGCSRGVVFLAAVAGGSIDSGLPILSHVVNTSAFNIIAITLEMNVSHTVSPDHNYTTIQLTDRPG
jgi:hypothetical protein